MTTPSSTGSARTPRSSLRLALLIIALAVVGLTLIARSGHGRALLAGLSSDPERRLSAIRLLQDQHGHLSDAMLRRLAVDTNAHVARRAIRVLAHRSGDANARTLRKLADTATDPETRTAALAATRSSSGIASPRLARILTDDPDPTIRAAAARALGARRDRASLPALLDALSDPDPTVRMAAITAINRFTPWRNDYRAEKDPAEQQEAISRIRSWFEPSEAPPPEQSAGH